MTKKDDDDRFREALALYDFLTDLAEREADDAVEKPYLELLERLILEGVEREDRTGVGTYSVFGHQMRFDLRRGFPLLTTKKVHFRSVVHELLWFLAGDTNAKTLQREGVKIWNEWATAEQCAAFGREEGDLGPIYGKQWTDWQVLYQVEPRLFEYCDPKVTTDFEKTVSVQASPNSTGLVGKTFNSRSGEFIVTREYSVPRKYNSSFFYKRLEVQFLETGYRTKDLSALNVRTGAVRDPYYPCVTGVAALGKPDIKDQDDKLLRQTWYGMIRRCYDKSHIGYENYGGKGFFVDNRWLVYENFLRDAKRLAGWSLKKEWPDDYELDKDFYASNKYSPETCVWSSKQDQSLNQRLAEPFEATSPYGYKFVSMGAKSFANRAGLCGAAVLGCLDGKSQQHKGWTFSRIKAEGTIRSRSFNQIKSLIASIKQDPNSRRHVISSWNVADLPSMALVPCHMTAQFYVHDGELSCQLYQRSGDAFLGVPFNIASYALLTHMVAHVTGLRVGEFIHTLGDAHLYRNHVEQARLQLSRPTRKAPMLTLASGVRNIFDFRFEHVTLHGYDPHPAIKAEVAV